MKKVTFIVGLSAALLAGEIAAHDSATCSNSLKSFEQMVDLRDSGVALPNVIQNYLRADLPEYLKIQVFQQITLVYGQFDMTKPDLMVLAASLCYRGAK